MKLMKKLFSFSLIGSAILFGSNPVKADWDYWAIGAASGGENPVYTCDSATGNCTLRSTKAFEGGSWNSKYTHVKGDKLYVHSGGSNYDVYDLSENEWSSVANWQNSYGDTFKRGAITKTAEGGIKIEFGDESLIEKKSNGELHIGENSWITKEENGRQKVYAKDAAGNPIPIDYTNGTKLLINGRDVEQSINNVGALSAALTGLPTVPTDTTIACGFGTGTHGGDFAFAGGCASKVNEKLSINYAASMTMPGQDYAGDFEDTFSARAGFVWKLGKSNKPPMISMNTKEKMQEKINSLEEKNEKILSKNNTLENTVYTLMARLERLEKVALGESKSKDLATIPLPFFKKK